MRTLGNVAASVLTALVLASASVPALGADSDADGLKDWFERRWGITSAFDRDSDDDGIVDSAEDEDGDRLGNLGEQRFRLDPRKRDTDRDGRPDGSEDHDRDGRSNAREQDHRAVPAVLRPSLGTAAADVSSLKSGCQTTHGSAEITTCSWGPRSSNTSLVLMGDSHAMMIAKPIKTVAEENGWRLTTLIKKACPPVLGIHNRAQRWVDDGASCRQWRRNALARLDADPPDHIILVHSDGYLIGTLKGRPIRGDAAARTWREGMKRTLAAMPAASDVIVMGDMPTNDHNPVSCLREHPKNVSKCVTPREPRAERDIENALRQAARAKGARFRTLYGTVCSYDPCPVIAGDVLMWRDRGHFTATYAEQLTPAFRKLLRDLIPAPAQRR